MFIGSTYSVFTSGDIDEEMNVYTTGTLDVTYTVSENNKMMVSNIPISDDNSSNIKPYRITVTNNGNVPYMFNLILEDTTASDVIDYKYIMTRVGELDPISLDKTKDNIIKENIIVEAGKSVDVDVRVWLSDKVQNSEIGKSFYAKLAVDGKAIRDENREIDNSDLVSDWTGVVITLDGNGATKEGTKSVDVMQGEKLPTVTIPSKGYNITYNANGGEVSKNEDTVSYKFLGYYTAKDGGVQYYNEKGVSDKENDFLENTTLYAKWENTTTNLIVPTRSGYNFIGWYSDEGLTQKVNVNDIEQDMTLYAKWELATYTISFDNNTGSGNMSDITCTYNEECLLPKNTFTKEGYSFKGWLDSQDGEVKYQDEGKMNYSNTNVRELILYAKWGVNAYKLTVNPNGGTWNGSTEPQEFTQNYGTTKSISVPSATPSYTFTYNLNGGTSASIANKTFSKPFSGWTKSGEGSITSNTPVATATQTYTYGAGDGTITANYSDATVTHPANPSKSFTITYNNNGTITTQTVNDTFGGWYTASSGGTQISNGSTVTGNQNLYAHWTSINVTLNTPTRTGYTFEGWYTASSGGTQITASNIRSNLSNNAITLYARWQAKTVEVKFMRMHSYGDTTSATRTYTYGVSNQTFNSGFTRTGYTGSGWSTSLNGSKVYEFTNGVSDAWIDANGGTTVTLYALWTGNTYTITLNNNSATSGGTSAIYEKYGTGVYLNSDGTNLMTSSANKITVPTKSGYTFGGYYTDSDTVVYSNGEYLNGTIQQELYTQRLYCSKYEIEGMYFALSDCELSMSSNPSNALQLLNTNPYTCNNTTDTVCSVIYKYSSFSYPNTTFLKYQVSGGSYPSATGTQLINASGYITSSFNTTLYSSNTTLYAKWTKN